MTAYWVSHESEQTGRLAFKKALETLTLRQDGKIEFHRFTDFEVFASVLCSCISWNGLSSRHERAGLTRSALLNSKRTKQASVAYFLKGIREGEKKLLKEPLKKFYLTSTLSFFRFPGEPTLRKKIQDVEVTVAPHFLKKLEMKKWFLDGFGDVDSSEPGYYSCLHVAVRARTQTQAADKCFEALDSFIGSINLFKNQKIGAVIGSGKARPFNTVRLGPFRVLHDSTGKVINESVWYDPDYIEERFLKKISPVFLELKSFLREFHGALDRSIFRDQIVRGLGRYNSALNQKDLYVRLTELWSALEILTGSTNDQSKVTIRRASFISSRIEERRLKLTHVAQLRNKYVHLGTRDSELRSVVEDLRLYVQAFIGFLLFDTKKIRSYSELTQILDMPSKIDEIKKIKRLSGIAERFASN